MRRRHAGLHLPVKQVTRKIPIWRKILTLSLPGVSAGIVLFTGKVAFYTFPASPTCTCEATVDPRHERTYAGTLHFE
jgi:hypothetical protein